MLSLNVIICTHYDSDNAKSMFAVLTNMKLQVSVGPTFLALAVIFTLLQVHSILKTTHDTYLQNKMFIQKYTHSKAAKLQWP